MVEDLQPIQDLAPIMAPGLCKCCGTERLFAPRWCCTGCFKRLPAELASAVWSVADLPADNQRKRAVVAACVDCLRAVYANVR